MLLATKPRTARQPLTIFFTARMGKKHVNMVIQYACRHTCIRPTQQTMQTRWPSPRVHSTWPTIPKPELLGHFMHFQVKTKA